MVRTPSFFFEGGASTHAQQMWLVLFFCSCGVCHLVSVLDVVVVPDVGDDDAVSVVVLVLSSWVVLLVLVVV